MESPYDKYEGFTPVVVGGHPEKDTVVAEAYGKDVDSQIANAVLQADAPLLLQDCREMFSIMALIKKYHHVRNAKDDSAYVPVPLIKELKDVLNRISERHKEG